MYTRARLNEPDRELRIDKYVEIILQLLHTISYTYTVVRLVFAQPPPSTLFFFLLYYNFSSSVLCIVHVH